MAEIKEKRERLTSEERRAKIIDAALTLFAEKGFNGTKTKEIAEAAGTSEPLIFWHFKSKEDIYREALRTLFGRHPVLPDIEKKMAQKDDHAVFKELALHVISHNRKDRRISRLAIFSALEGFPLAKIVHQDSEVGPALPEILSGYIKQRIDEGDFQKQNAEIAAQLFVDLIYTCVLDKEAAISGPPLDYSDEEIVENLVRIFVKGLKK
ncbi:MAG: TetR/AcrR family transcriptional regulator [candidate division KSB1 bacterium]|nr:TetR/AcrR family transcriptional regulator [candidate division KSB1 bacterium]